MSLTFCEKPQQTLALMVLIGGTPKHIIKRLLKASGIFSHKHHIAPPSSSFFGGHDLSGAAAIARQNRWPKLVSPSASFGILRHSLHRQSAFAVPFHHNLLQLLQPMTSEWHRLKRTRDQPCGYVTTWG